MSSYLLDTTLVSRLACSLQGGPPGPRGSPWTRSCANVLNNHAAQRREGMVTTPVPLQPFPSEYLSVQVNEPVWGLPSFLKKASNLMLLPSRKFAAPGTANGSLSRPYCGV